MLTSRRISLALISAALALSTFAGPALAAEPTSVSVRVEGLAGTLLTPTQVTTGTAPLSKDGNSEHSCPGTTALAALELATSGNWSGPWESSFHQYAIFTIAGETHLFEPEATANYYWSFWLDEHESSEGACEAELHAGDRVLFFPACFGSACPPSPSPLGITAPASANVGEAVPVTVRSYAAGGEATAVSGASITGAEAPVATDPSGLASVRFAAPGTYTLRASAPASVRTETIICVHAGNDGNCGTSAPGRGSASVPAAAGATAPYRGPFAVVAETTGVLDGHVYGAHQGPRLLAGNVLAHASVTSVTLELRRDYRGRCSSYDATTERFRAARCGSGRAFAVAGGSAFSYLLPAALAPGRYVLDVQASDVAGNKTALARGTSRIVFYVR